MKKLAILLCSAFFAVGLFAQSQPSTANLPLSIIVEDLPQPFPINAKVQLINKINQMLTANGLASFDAFSGFFISANANPIEKNIISGAPVQISQTLEVTFYIADYFRQNVFATYSVTAKGVGENETKSYLNAFKRVNIASPEAKQFIETGKEKIVNYYDTEAENIFAKARQLAAKHDYEAALFELCSFPTVCKAYPKSIEIGNEVYKHYVDYVAQQCLQQAKSAWMAEQNANGAAAAGEWLAQILPEASCYDEGVELYKEIKAKILDDWKFEMKKYQDGVDLEKERINAWKQVGIAYGKNQQPVTTNVTWLH